MLKRELIAALARKHFDLKIKDVELIARLVFDAMGGALAAGKDIELRGFGTFRLRTYASREARNPGTGQTVDIEARNGVIFKAGLEMRERLNGK